MPENFYNEKAARGLIGRFKIVVGGMAALAPDLAPDGLAQGGTRRDGNRAESRRELHFLVWNGTSRQPTPLSRHAVNPGRGSWLDRKTMPSTLPKRSMR
jgi:hypothetical protein